jgi:hypothetical protein
MLTWWNDLECKAKAMTAMLALLGVVASGAWLLDARYAKAADLRMQQQTLEKSLGDIKVGQMQSDRRALLKEKFALEAAAQKGRLTPLERERLKAVEADLADLEQQITLQRKTQAQ